MFDLHHRRALAIQIAWRLYGMPYVWGGDDPIFGFDCSGMCVEILKSVGILRHGEDLTSRMLARRFKSVDSPKLGCLAFWGDSRARINHVEMVVSTENGIYTIGASGGGGSTKTIEDAAKQNAFIKIRPITYRRHFKGYVDPFIEEGEIKEI